MAGICTTSTSPGNCGHRTMTIVLDGTPIEQALMDLEDDELSHGGCKAHMAREWEKVLALPDRRVTA